MWHEKGNVAEIGAHCLVTEWVPHFAQRKYYRRAGGEGEILSPRQMASAQNQDKCATIVKIGGTDCANFSLMKNKDQGWVSLLKGR